ncbi:hypothetical protein [Brevundimonas sp.]|uniref:hypothetical protein n=1 Tax=Brevundimonas sp. TaxID=1871086 RepID=UPI002628AC3B|nr:hypothetical protein [Brevundimonas sp.]
MQLIIQSLEDAAPEDRGGYVERPEGGYQLHPEIIALLDTHQGALAAEEARLTKAEARLRRAVIDRALDCALTTADVQPVYRRAVSALLQGQMEFDVVEEPLGPQAYALTAYGPVSVANAVSSWLMSPGGEPYRPKVRTHGSGRYGEMMRALRTVH